MRFSKAIRYTAIVCTGGIVIQSGCGLNAQAFAYQAFNQLLPILVSSLAQNLPGGTPTATNTGTGGNSNANSNGSSPTP